ncbi:MAG: protein-export chaperone SecB [Bacteroidales bacterium]|nr:protein-export chaperone SecB [Bacteroidales bacterium]
MKIPKSDLELIDFIIINSNYTFQEPKDQESFNVRKVFSDYDINIDFGDTEPNEKEDNIFNFFIKVEINNCEKPLPGYSIFCEGVGLFKISNLKSLNEQIANNLLKISPLSICINNMRSYIMNITTYYPFGKFVLPSVDINNLIKAKIRQQE